MSEAWGRGEEPAPFQPKGVDWLRIVMRGVAMGIVTFGGLLLLLICRLIERPAFGMHRPVTPWITRVVCWIDCRILGLRVTASGPKMRGNGVIVANHVSWLDILVLNSFQTIYYVSKSEVASWPGIGWLARATGTVFLERKRTKAVEHRNLFENRLSHGHRLLFFPEGTSTDGLRVLPFKTTLFQAFFADGLRDSMQVQALSLRYIAPEGQAPEFYGWFGDMDFGPSLLQVLAARPQGRVKIIRHAPVAVRDFANRKTLAAHVETQCRDGVADLN